MTNFGLPDFPYQGADAQGGYLSNNVPNDPLGQSPAPPAAQAPGLPGATPAPQSPIAAPSPLAGGPLAPGAGQGAQQPAANPEPTQPPPAAGIGSPFGRPGL